MRCSVTCRRSSACRRTIRLRAIRQLVDEILREMSREFDGLYATVGRPSIPPERLLRAQLLQIFYSIRSERLLMEQLDYNMLFRWFVGLDMDEPIWDADGLHQESRSAAEPGSRAGISSGASSRAPSR